MMMFVLKKLVSRFFFPLSLVIVLLLLGVFLKKRRRSVILAGVAILYLDPEKTRYIKIWGNHDLSWKGNEARLRRIFPGIVVYEAALLDGHILMLHGHQADNSWSGVFAGAAKYAGGFSGCEASLFAGADCAEKSHCREVTAGFIGSAGFAFAPLR